MDKRQHQWPSRTCVVCALAAHALFVGGCPLPKPLATVKSGVAWDFKHLKTLSDQVLDLTDFGWSTVSREDLVARWAAAGTDLEVRDLPRFDITYMVLTRDAARTQTVVLPGSCNLENFWIAALGERVFDSELGIRLHTGFLVTARALHKDLATRLREGYDLSLVGYSLGGSSGVILARYLQNAGWNVVEVVTFGQAPITDALGAAAFDGLPLLRIIAGNDPVPRFRADGYAQFGPALILLDGPYVMCLPSNRPGINTTTEQIVFAAGALPDPHSAYRQLMASKVGVEVYELCPEDTQALPPGTASTRP